jgi:uncharacterized protein YdeI (YjbR/CyaY-like superfamily)
MIAAAKTSTLKRPRQRMPAFVKAALAARRLTAAYKARPPYQRNDYLMWINAAKQDATKERRLAQMLDELRAGDRYMTMLWHPPRRA